MARRFPLRFVLILLSALSFPHAMTAAESAKEKPLNLLVIVADDLGLQLGVYGDKAARTPNIDALAARGRVFENAYVAQASCSPSRSAIFTGLYPHTNGQIGLAHKGFQLHGNLYAQTIPALLNAAGYDTALIGKLHVGQDKKFPFGQHIKVDMRDVRKVAQQAGNFLSKTTEPFFFMASYTDPHVMGLNPRPPKEAFPTQYKGVPETPIRVGDVPPFPFQRLDTPEQIERVTQYYNAVARFDEGVGMLLEKLRESGHDEDTLILLIGDHGPPFFRGKTSCYEAGVRIPMIAVWPGVFAKNDRSDALVSTVDILPTLLDAAHAQFPADALPLQGKSLRDTLHAEKNRPFLATEFHFHTATNFFPRRAIRNDRFKLIHNLRAGQTKPLQSVDGDMALNQAREEQFEGTPVREAFETAANPPEFELYDLSSDPWEFHNLAANPEHAGRMEIMKTALLDWRQRTSDPLLDPVKFSAMAALENPAADDNEGKPSAPAPTPPAAPADVR